MKKVRVGILDYGVGNIKSIYNALKIVGFEVIIIQGSLKSERYDVLILPGVGSFNVAIDNLNNSGLVQELNIEAIDRRRPILGICLGMQLMATTSSENGINCGLNWIKGKVIKIPDNLLPIPHVGWNNIKFTSEEPMFERVIYNNHFYFDHSYYFSCDNIENIKAEVDYGIKLPCIIQDENILGFQFHPEKSHNNGLKLLKDCVNKMSEYA